MSEESEKQIEIEHLTRTEIVAHCSGCDFERRVARRDRRLSGMIGGHAKKFDCGGDVHIDEESSLLCDSCGVEQDDDVAVSVVVGDARYQERTLCDFCRDYRDYRDEKRS